MVASLETNGLKSVQLRQSYRDQIEKHKADKSDTKTKSEII